MNFVTAYHTDIGIRKKTNQDSLLIEQAAVKGGSILFASVCDGMGGLSKGELASGSLVRRLSDWFCKEFPLIMEKGFSPQALQESWMNLIEEANRKIGEYGAEHDIDLGTTCTAFLAIDNSYYLFNVGDSRIYLISDMLYQLTKDQTYVQREIDCGRMTPEQAAVDPQRSVLLQCIGASDVVVPDFFTGELLPNQCILMCSDGFAHMVSPMEIYERLNPAACTGTDIMRANLTELTELCKERQEKDNITALLLKTL